MQTQIRKPAMQTGLIIGLLFSTRFFLSIQGNMILSGISYCIALFILFILYQHSVKLRDKNFDGVISYGKAFAFIILSIFYASLISATSKFIYFQFFNTEYLTNMYDQLMLSFENMKLSGIEESEELLQNLLRPSSFAFLSIWGNMLGGLFGALIMAGIVKKEKSIFDKEIN